MEALFQLYWKMRRRLQGLGNPMSFPPPLFDETTTAKVLQDIEASQMHTVSRQLMGYVLKHFSSDFGRHTVIHPLRIYIYIYHLGAGTAFRDHDAREASQDITVFDAETGPQLQELCRTDTSGDSSPAGSQGMDPCTHREYIISVSGRLARIHE